MWAPTGRRPGLSAATPAMSVTGLPTAAPLTDHWIVPLGVEPGPLTVAVKRRLSP